MNSGNLSEYLPALLAHLHGAVISGEALGYVGAAVTIATYSMRTMIPLRVAGLVANCLFITYGILMSSYPQLVLHTVLLPLNLVRLTQMMRMVAMVKAASGGNHSLDWIKSFTHSRKVRRGEIIFARGEVADSMYFPVSGQYRLVEISVDVKPGDIVGEIGFVSPDNKRTQTFICTEGGEPLVITYNHIRQLYFQNPNFGFFFLQLITKRLLDNHSSIEQRMKDLTVEDQAEEEMRGGDEGKFLASSFFN